MFGVSLFTRKLVAPNLRRRMISSTTVSREYEAGFENVFGPAKDPPPGYTDSYSSNLKYYFPSTTNYSFKKNRRESHDGILNINVKYPRGMRKCLTIAKGKKLEEDVLTLLSNGGKRDYLVRNNGDKVSVDSLAGKHLLICCFKVPFPRKSIAAYACRSMIAAYSELRLKKDNNLEMVMVAKMAAAPLLADEEEEAAFNRFFEPFPCLAIPFWDTESRDFVCKSLGLTRPHKHFAALVLDPDQMVLQTDKASFYDYGASGYPYSDDRLDELVREEEEISRRLDSLDYYYFYCPDAAPPLLPTVSLVELLGGSDLLLSRFGSTGDTIHISELSSKKCVALYICLDMEFMHRLEDIREKCAAGNREFEVVLVHMPFYTDTAFYVRAVKAAMKRNKLSSWWVMPGGEAARKLFRLSGYYVYPRDECIFVVDGGNYGEIRGRRRYLEVSRGAESYPFSRKIKLDEILCRIRSITLDSVLGYDNQLIQLSSDSDSEFRVKVSELKGKNVVLYLDYCDGFCRRYGSPRIYPRIYPRMQKDFPNSQLVFVPLDDIEKLPQNDAWRHAIPCLMLPHSEAVVQGSVIRQLSPDGEKHPAMIAFGEDGRVRSIEAHRGNDVDSTFEDTLFKEIYRYCLTY